MMFLGMFMLVVLPLFLVVSAQTVEKGNGGGAKFVGIVLYFFALLSILSSVLIIVEVF
jgi:hypothetical protein